LGGITGSIVVLNEEAYLEDTGCAVVRSAGCKIAQNNRFHQQISASYYASPSNEGTAVNQLDIVVLSALEVDCEYNVNVLTGSDGVIRGAIGGHPDTAFGASVSIVVCPLLRGRIPCVVSRVQTVVTPGKIVDVIVTDQGVAINPRRPDLIE
jgi:citrate lyase subunit alpha/citrate CoA-transferase